VGGSALRWQVTLTDDLFRGGFVQLEFTMRKFGSPDVELEWELLIID
jgi:hypothetical protein